MTTPAAIFTSVQLSSNRPRQSLELLDNIESTAENPEGVEVLIHIDTGDTAMEELMRREQGRRRLRLRWLDTALVKSFADIWKVYNPLFRLTAPEAYFIILISDEMRFETRGWDTILKRYEGYHPDHIFRLRGSRYRFRNYTDFWECGYAPDSLAFYTRRWLALQGDWNPCGGPDSFQQSVAFYLHAAGESRDIAVRELHFSGEGAYAGLEGQALERRLILNNRAWFTLMSHPMQQEACRRAALLKNHIATEATGSPVAAPIRRLSWWRVTLTNLGRMPMVFYYSGGGEYSRDVFIRSVRLMRRTYWPSSEGLARRCAHIYDRCSRLLRPALSRLKAAKPTRKTANRDEWVRLDPTGSPNTASPVTAAAPTAFTFQLPPLSLPELAALLDNIEATALHPHYMEALMPIEPNDAFLQEQAKRRIKLRFIKPGTAPAMVGAMHPQAYFAAFLTADMRFETQGWDTVLLNYLGAFPDHIFRLRLSSQRFRNYANAGECVTAPDRFTFYTRRWLAIQEGAGPHADIAAFQQCVSYHLFTSDPFSHAQAYRDMAVPFLHVAGKTAGSHDAGTLLSAGVQQEARRRAIRLKASIFYHACLTQVPDKPLILLEDRRNEIIVAQSPGGAQVKTFSYKGSRAHG